MADTGGRKEGRTGLIFLLPGLISLIFSAFPFVFLLALPGLGSFLNNVLAILLRDKFGGFYHIHFIVFGFADSDFEFHITVDRAKGNAVIILSVGRKPADFFSYIPMA